MSINVWPNKYSVWLIHLEINISLCCINNSFLSRSASWKWPSCNIPVVAFPQWNSVFHDVPQGTSLNLLSFLLGLLLGPLRHSPARNNFSCKSRHRSESVPIYLYSWKVFDSNIWLMLHDGNSFYSVTLINRRHKMNVFWTCFIFSDINQSKTDNNSLQEK